MSVIINDHEYYTILHQQPLHRNKLFIIEFDSPTNIDLTTELPHSILIGYLKNGVIYILII